MNTNYSSTHNQTQAFTIVELLVVIVVIGILAAITVVSYSGVTSRVVVASLQSDLSNASKRLKMYQVTYDSYPTTLGADKCPTAPNSDTNYCLRSSSNNSYVNYNSNGDYFTITATDASNLYYTISDNSPPRATSLNPTNWIAIGTQIWAKANLNVGTMVTGVTAQTNDSVLQKYCYGDDEANCTIHGALYQWDEAMQYVTTNGAQGICPAGSHIPTDTDWKTLEMYLGMTQAQADAVFKRGTDQGAQLKLDGSSGLNMPLAGGRATNGVFVNRLLNAGIWSSSVSDDYVWYRGLNWDYATVYSMVVAKDFGFSVRCVGN